MVDARVFAERLAAGATTICHCWILRRRDGVVLGFTDHDLPLVMEGVVCKADTGLTAEAFSQTTGLSVDNSEAAGVLNDASISEADLFAGRYDQAEIEAWLVDWLDPEIRTLRFRGTLGEIEAGGGSFRAELRGLAEALNQPRGRVYQPLCSARLGDAACRVDVNDPAFAAEAPVAAVTAPNALTLPALAAYGEGFFTRGRLEVLDGAAAGLSVMVKRDALVSGERQILLWQELRAAIAAGDRVRLQAGCDKRAATCLEKFDNLLNFRGFPHIPGEDWLMAYPGRGGRNDGGSMNR